MKPLVSVEGYKSDIVIVQNNQELSEKLKNLQIRVMSEYL